MHIWGQLLLSYKENGGLGVLGGGSEGLGGSGGILENKGPIYILVFVRSKQPG